VAARSRGSTEDPKIQLAMAMP